MDSTPPSFLIDALREIAGGDRPVDELELRYATGDALAGWMSMEIRNGRVRVNRRPPAGPERSREGPLSDDDGRQIVGGAIECTLWTAASSREGAPDELRPMITLGTRSRGTFTVELWVGEVTDHLGFNTVLSHVQALAVALGMPIH